MNSIYIKKHNDSLYNWLLGIVLIVFAVVKFSDLFLPYFWDELGVYAQCAAYQYNHSLSLMPISIPPDLSRGHPLLFTFFNALVMRLFGCTHVTAHAFSLFVSISLFLALYFYTAKYFDRLTALVTVILLAFQPTFLAQSAMIQPEVMLSFFIFLSLVAFYEDKYLLFALFASLSILTKESAIVLPCVAIAYSAFQYLFFRSCSDIFKPINLLLIFSPYLFFTIFLVTQKYQNGWYFFPYHIGSIELSLNKFINQFRQFFNYIFWLHGRYWWIKIILTALLISFVKSGINLSAFRKNFLLLLAFFMLAFLAFSSLSFLGERYVLVVILAATVLTAVSIVAIFQNKFLIFTVTAMLCYLSFTFYEDKVFHWDVDMGYRRQVNAMKQAIDYVESLPGECKYVYGEFPVYFAVNFVEGGYLHTHTTINHLPTMNRDSFFYIQSNPGVEFHIDETKFKKKPIAVFTDKFAQSTVFHINKR